MHEAFLVPRPSLLQNGLGMRPSENRSIAIDLYFLLLQSVNAILSTMVKDEMVSTISSTAILCNNPNTMCTSSAPTFMKGYEEM